MVKFTNIDELYEFVEILETKKAIQIIDEDALLEQIDKTFEESDDDSSYYDDEDL